MHSNVQVAVDTLWNVETRDSADGCQPTEFKRVTDWLHVIIIRRRHVRFLNSLMTLKASRFSNLYS